MDVALPFSGIDFFLLSFASVAILLFCKRFLSSYLKYKYILFSLIAVYITFFLPFQATIGILLFSIYIYLIYYVFSYNDYRKTLLPILLVSLPMILFKLDVDVMYKVIGISYITFRVIQAISDQKNYGSLDFFEFTSYLFFPPTLLAGPIDRSYRFKSDLDNGYNNISTSNFVRGWELLVIGGLFKFVLAEFVAKFWLGEIDATSTSIATMVNSAYSYTAYFYFDFAGYSAMAMGVGIMLGISVPKNFDKPYLAQNPQEFWRRFHITLGAWLTDYFFKPIYMYLQRFSYLRGRRLLVQNISITLTFLLMGMWNGLVWHYIFSGLLFGLYSSIHNCYVHYVKKGGADIFSVSSNILSLSMKRLIMVNSVVLALYVFSGRVPL
jgi:membrane protein involved in D-alanine export